MFPKNCVVRCVGYRQSERLFVVGRLYNVINNVIVSDVINHRFNHLENANRSIVDWLSDWYIFELVTHDMLCEICGKPVNGENHVRDGKVVCDTCMEENTVFCDCCGRLTLEQNVHYINGEFVCDDCMERYYFVCDCCGEVVHRNHIRWSMDCRICDCCADNYYYTCADCGELIPEDDAVWDDASESYYCESCYNELRNSAIHDYYYKPVPIFYGGNTNMDMYMGVELEVDKGGEDGENAERLLNIANNMHEHIYIKHDGSLNYGFEIVSHPATLDYHTHDIAWAEIMNHAVSMGYRSHDTATCGLHVHVSRRALGDTYTEREKTVSKIVYFVENNWEEIVKFTRRNLSNLERWACRYGISKTVSETYENAKYDDDRYRAINLLNDNTIEFRIFRGTLNHSTFIATLQLVYLICTTCKNASEIDIESMNWKTFIDSINFEKYHELSNYLDIRGLKV